MIPFTCGSKSRLKSMSFNHTHTHTPDKAIEKDEDKQHKD